METEKKEQMNHFPQWEEKPGLVERYATTIKLFFVAMLTLMLLIPLAMIQSLIGERQNTRQEVVREITSKWGGEQTITGPCLVIPYEEIRVEEKREIVERRNLLLLPETLDAKISTSVEERRRGIYDASVYRSNILLTGEFDISVIARQNLNPSQVKWNDVRMIIGLSDLKGIQEQVSLEQDGEVTIFEPGIPVENLEPGRGSASDNMLYELFSVGLNAKPAFPTPDSALQEIYPFSVAMRLNGSRGIYVVQRARQPPHPSSRTGQHPVSTGNSFPRPGRSATRIWESGEYSTLTGVSTGYPFRQQQYPVDGCFAVWRPVYPAVDQYRQNMRSVKYGILVLLLTFVAVLFIELMRKRRIKPSISSDWRFSSSTPCCSPCRNCLGSIWPT